MNKKQFLILMSGMFICISFCLSLYYSMREDKLGLTLTDLNSTDLQSAFPTLYNANGALIEASIAALEATTTMTLLASAPNLATIGTIGTGVWNGTDIALNYIAGGASDANAYDFGGATSIEIPNGASPTVDATGEIALDTTNDQTIIYGTSSAHVIDEDGKKGFCFNSASSSPGFINGDYDEIGALDYGITVYQQSCKVKSGTSLVVNLSDNGTNDATSITCATSRAVNTVSSNNTFTKLEDIRLEYGTNTGTTTSISFCAYYRITAN